MAAIFTKTVLRSPVVRWILQARVRHKNLNDVIFVGDDFVHVKQLRQEGTLEHVAFKTDFDGRIRAAKVFTVEPIPLAPDESTFMKVEYSEPTQSTQKNPPQYLVLTTERHELLFLSLSYDGAGSYRFVHHAVPLPTFDRTIFQPGEHLAIDHDSRSLAVAANEREVVIYSSKSAQEVSNGLRSIETDWSPISAQRQLQVDGVIQHIDFLIPHASDPNRIMLLLNLVDQSRTSAVLVDWYVGTDLHDAQIHAGQRLDLGGVLPNLLVPLRNASFILVTGSVITRWDNLATGSINGYAVDVVEVDIEERGASSRMPIWVNWCRPSRRYVPTETTDNIYFIREDGVTIFLQFSSLMGSSHAGDFRCHVGSAFASVGDDLDPDILIAAGDMSSGQTCKIGHWSSPLRLPDWPRPDTMRMSLVEVIPNWASVTDMVISRLPGKNQRTRDSVIVTSGRQPYGNITELRQGLEAKQSAYIELDNLRSVTNVWALPLAGVGDALLVLSSPVGTRFFRTSTDATMKGFEELRSPDLALEGTDPTLAAAYTTDGKLIQVTTCGINVAHGVSANFEDAIRLNLRDNVNILASAVDSAQAFIVTAERTRSTPTMYSLVVRTLPSGEADTDVTSSSWIKCSTEIGSEPLCLALLAGSESSYVILATSDGYLRSYRISVTGDLALTGRISSTSPTSDSSLCDSAVVLSSGTDGTLPGHRHLVVCGLRDGRLSLVELTPEGSFGTHVPKLLDFGQSAVKLTRHPDDPSRAYASCGSDLCLLSLPEHGSHTLEVQNIWISDLLRPEVVQAPVVACTHMPPAYLLASPDLAESFITISGDECSVNVLSRQSRAVPRQIAVSGTPTRLIHAEQQRCLVSASLRYDVQYFSGSLPQSGPEERRQVWPVIDFIPSRSNAVSFAYEMQPGEGVYALLEWSFKSSEEKMYSFVMVGGSYARHNKPDKGYITFLQPLFEGWGVVSVKGSPAVTKFDAPVYALALLDEMTYVACVGPHVHINRFSLEQRKWSPVCRPFQLSSIGVFVTVEDGHISVSTARDGFVRLKMCERSAQAQDDDRCDYHLIANTNSPRADTLLSHMVSPRDPGLALLSTSTGHVLGLAPSDATKSDASGGITNGSSTTSDLVLAARLPRSLTRVRPCDIRLPWRPGPPPGVGDILIGCAADGTLVGIAMLPAGANDNLWRQLFWLQRLCEWSEELSPHTYLSSAYTSSDRPSVKKERTVPIGLNMSVDRPDNMIVLRSNRNPISDKHIDGDILARLMERGGAEVLKRILHEHANREDRVGEWLRRHMRGELEAVDQVIDVVARLLGCWM